MVITERFAWAHLPKTGGDATYRMFASVSGLVRFADPLDSNDKHETFWNREQAIAGKLRVMNIRRLPHWALSAAHHKATAGLFPERLPLPLPSAEEMADSTDPDDLLRWMTDGPRLAVDRWLRTEFLRSDVLALLDDLGELTAEARESVSAVAWSGGEYDRDLSRRFSPGQIERLYQRNPGWAEIERSVYGDLLDPAG